MFNGSHIVIYTQDADADRALLRDTLGLKFVDAGDGWLIFGLPAAEVAFHPHASSTAHELYLMCDDLGGTIDTLESAGIACASPVDEGWGILSSMTLPGGSQLGFYQPRHARP